MHSLLSHCTFVSFFFSLFSETLVQAASQGSTLLFAQKAYPTVAQGDAAIGDNAKHGHWASMGQGPSSLNQSPDLFLPDTPSK